jgi:hypothetical protein
MRLLILLAAFVLSTFATLTVPYAAVAGKNGSGLYNGVAGGSSLVSFAVGNIDSAGFSVFTSNNFGPSSTSANQQSLDLNVRGLVNSTCPGISYGQGVAAFVELVRTDSNTTVATLFSGGTATNQLFLGQIGKNLQSGNIVPYWQPNTAKYSFRVRTEVGVLGNNGVSSCTVSVNTVNFNYFVALAI